MALLRMQALLGRPHSILPLAQANLAGAGTGGGIEHGS
jgi:hypothetical protein